MSLDIADGRVVITDQGATVFDTNEALFVTTDYVVGSVTIPARTAITQGFSNGSVSSSPVNVDINHVLGTVNPGANVVRGVFTATATTGQNIVGLGSYNAGGTCVYPISLGIGSLITFTFICSGGSLYLNERSIAQAYFSFRREFTFSVTLSSIALSYKLYCGTFV
jgi:hypothetical protein